MDGRYNGRYAESDYEDVGLGGEEDWDRGVASTEVLGGRWGSEKDVKDGEVNGDGELYRRAYRLIASV